MSFRARWYHAETGRWLSKDPIGIRGGLNQYVFVSNNPVNRLDPDGRADVSLVPSTDSRYNESVNYIESGGNGFITANTHGGQFGNTIIMDNGQGGWTDGSGADVVNAILNSPAYSVGDVPILFICNAGNGSVAQDVANRLNTIVIAPNGYVDSDGNIWTSLDGRSPDGEWKIIPPNNCSE